MPSDLPTQSIITGLLVAEDVDEFGDAFGGLLGDDVHPAGHAGGVGVDIVDLAPAAGVLQQCGGGVYYQ